MCITIKKAIIPGKIREKTGKADRNPLNIKVRQAKLEFSPRILSTVVYRSLHEKHIRKIGVSRIDPKRRYFRSNKGLIILIILF